MSAQARDDVENASWNLDAGSWKLTVKVNAEGLELENMPDPHVVIIGGGFGGLYAARALRRTPVQITLVDRRNHHVFQPLLYQVATAALSPGDIASPIRWILRRQRNTEVLLADVVTIDPSVKRITLADGSLSYDFLIVAAGATHAYFGHDEWQTTAPGLKTLEDALDIRRRVLMAFERAEREPNAERRKALLTFVVVGGGPTGVELAGALAEISRLSLARDFRHFDPSSARILLIEAGPAILATFPEPLREAARQDLVRLGVVVRTGHPVTSVMPGAVQIAGETVAAETVLWAAGVAASPLGKSLGRSDRSRRARQNRAGLDPSRSPGCIRHRRSRVAERRRRQAATRRRTGRDPDGRAPARNIERAIEHQPLARFHLPRSWQPGDDRPRVGRCRLGPAAAEGIHRLARVGLCPHLQPDRVQEPSRRVRPVGMGVFHLPTVGALDPERGARGDEGECRAAGVGSP